MPLLSSSFLKKPTFLKRSIKVIDIKDGDTDPHGIFKYVGTIPFATWDNEEINIEGLFKTLKIK